MADDYERLADKTELSYEEALMLKEEMRKRGERGGLTDDLAHPARWHVVSRTDSFAAASFLNAPPLTRPGEGMVSNRPDGMVDIYWFAAV
jgi:hypothetical protein